MTFVRLRKSGAVVTAGLLVGAATMASAGKETIVSEPDIRPVNAGKPTLGAEPSSGRAPLAVRFTSPGDGRSWFGGVWLKLGDGNSKRACLPGKACRDIVVEHTYAKPGTYNYALEAFGEGPNEVLAEGTVVVSD